MTTPTTIEPRFVVRGTLNETSGIYTLFLDNGTEVDTDSSEIATAASGYAKAKKPLTIETELRNGRQVITELAVAPTPAKATETSEPAKADAVATRTATPPPAQPLAKRPDLPTGLINDPLKLTEQLQALERHYNVLSPMIAVSEMAPGFGVNLVVVKIDPTIVDQTTGRGTDTYYSKKIHKPNERAFSKNGLLKISQAFGIQWTQPRRVDNGSVRNYWHWQYFGYLRTYDGQQIPLTGSKELDLRDGSAEIEGQSAAQVKIARSFGNEICETKAMERAIRHLLRQVYTVEELNKPFLIPRSSFTPDMSDPEIKKLVTQQAMSGLGAMYPPPMPMAIPETIAPVDDTEPAKTETAAAAPKKVNPFDDSPSATTTSTAGPKRPLGGRKVTDVVPFSGETNGRKWTKITVTFDDDIKAVTFDTKLADIATEAKRTGAWVKASTPQSEKRPDQNDLESIRIIDPNEQDLPLDGGEDEGY